MRCSGGMDANGCMMPDTCMPAFGKYRICFLFLVCKKLQFNQKIAADGVDEVKCPNVCPVPCGLEEVFCPGGLMQTTGCPMPNTCMPKIGKCFGN